MINKVLESGYVGKYINSGTAANGSKWISFSLYQKTGRETNQYLPCVVWDNDKIKNATNFEQYVKVGNYLLVEGHLNVKKKEDRTVELQLVVDSIRDNVEPAPREAKPEPRPTFDAIPTPQVSITSDDLPF